MRYLLVLPEDPRLSWLDRVVVSLGSVGSYNQVEADTVTVQVEIGGEEGEVIRLLVGKDGTVELKHLRSPKRDELGSPA